MCQTDEGRFLEGKSRIEACKLFCNIVNRQDENNKIKTQCSGYNFWGGWVRTRTRYRKNAIVNLK